MTLVFWQFAKNIFNKLYYRLMKIIRNSRQKKERKVPANRYMKGKKICLSISASVAAGLWEVASKIEVL